MNNFFTEQELKYIKIFFKYLKAHGHDYGTFEILEYDKYWENSWRYREFFNDRLNIEEDYYMEVLPFMNDIIMKITKHCSDLVPDDVDSERAKLEIKFNVPDLAIIVEYVWYEDQDDPDYMEWTEEEIEEDKEEFIPIFEALERNKISFLRVGFNGYGDSGEIEDWTDSDGGRVNTIRVIEDFCYQKLENYGGWEINEGSYGSFEFNTNPKYIELHFNWRNEVEEYKEIVTWEFDFDLNKK